MKYFINLPFFLLVTFFLIFQLPVALAKSQANDAVISEEKTETSLSEKEIIIKTRRMAGRSNFTAAAAEASAYLRNNQSVNLCAYSTGLTLILGMENSALERFTKVQESYESLSSGAKKIALLINIYLGNFGEALTLNADLSEKHKIGFISSHLMFAKISSVSLNKVYFAFFILFLMGFLSGIFKLLGVRFSFASLLIFATVFCAIWLGYQKLAGWHFLKIAVGLKPSRLLVENAFSHILMGTVLFIFLYIMILPLKMIFLAQKRFIHSNEFFSAIFLCMSFQKILTFAYYSIFAGLKFSTSMPFILAGSISMVVFMFLIWKSYCESYSFAAKSINVASAQNAVASTKKVAATELEISNSNRQLIKEENFKEADRVAQSFFILKNGAVRPEFIMRMIEIKLEIDKVAEAKELLNKIEKVKNIEAKRQQLSLSSAYVRICNGDLGGYLKASQEAKNGEAILGQSDLYILDFCEGLFLFQKKEYQKAIAAFSNSLRNAKTAAAKMKIKFWTAFANFEMQNTAEIEKLVEESKKIMGLELVQSYKLMIESLLKAAQDKTKEGIKLSKNALDFNETSAAAAFIVCRLATDDKAFSEAQAAALRLDKEHFLGHRALELTV